MKSTVPSGWRSAGGRCPALGRRQRREGGSYRAYRQVAPVSSPCPATTPLSWPMISPGGQPRRARAAGGVRRWALSGGAELAHERGGVDAVAGHVADDEGDLAIVQQDDVEPVAAHLRGPAGGLVAAGGLQPRPPPGGLGGPGGRRGAPRGV